MKVLSPVSLVEDLEMYMLSFEKGGTLTSAPHFPKTEEYITVIEGKVRIRAGENSTELEAGDFATYHCDIEHSIENIFNGTSSVHMLVRFNK